MGACLIYALIDPRDGRWRYVGKSSSGLTRPRAHGGVWCQKNEGHLPVHRWIAKLREQGREYEVLVLEHVAAEGLAAAECDWIAESRRQGMELLNLTDGGEGAAGYRQSDETRFKRSRALRGRVYSLETRKKMSQSKTKRPRDLSRMARGGFRAENPNKGKSIVDDVGILYSSVGEAARIHGVDRAAIRRVLKGKKFSSAGRVFRYLEST